MREIQLKARLVEYLLKHAPTAMLGAELMFSHGSRIADIVTVEGELATVYEIKSAKDTVSRLKYQIESYKLLFDYCYVVCEVENLESVTNTVADSIGIVVISKNGVSVQRESRLFKRKNKHMLASVLSTQELKRLAKNPKVRSKYELCEYVAKNFSAGQLYQLSRKSLKDRFTLGTNLLKLDVNEAVTSDDIQTITRPAPSLLRLGV